MFAICVEAIIYLLLYNFHDCTFNTERPNPWALNPGKPNPGTLNLDTLNAGTLNPRLLNPWTLIPGTINPSIPKNNATNVLKLFHATSAPRWLLKSNSFELYPDYFIMPYFYPMLTNLTQSVRLQVAVYLKLSSICVTYGMSSSAIRHQILQNALLWEKEAIFKSDQYPRHISLLTYFAYLQPI